MLTIEIMGGLGNQLFQIFAVIAYSLTNKIPFYFEKKNSTRSDRPFYWDNFFLSLKPFLRETYETNLPIYKEQSNHYTAIPPFPHINKPFKLFGYFQSYKYFQEKEQEIFRFMRLHQQKEKIKESSIKKYDFTNSIALHFRIGDYKAIQQHHPVMEVTYYIAALQHIISTTKREDWKIIYFYEEQDKNDVIDKIRLLQEKFKNVTFVPIHTEINDYEQVLMMSLCQHNIIANSSFSWWGAYFNTNPDKIVCYPEKWFGPAQGNKKMDDLFPESWVRIYTKKSILIVTESFHDKNKDGLERVIKHLGWNSKYGNVKEIENYDIIYSPTYPIDASKYPNKRFVFGPHFSVFPDYKLLSINNIHNNCVYIQPSKWAADGWINLSANKYLPVKPMSFPVDTVKFKPISNKKKDKVFIYFKRRKPEELHYIQQFLEERHIPYKIFDYIKRYSETEYLEFLQQSKYGIIVDAHESQGFAIEEALSCNVPLLVWNTKYMSQEYGSTFENIPCTTIPYWDERCGEYFYTQQDFERKYSEFIGKLESYQPRQYILDNLSVEKCAQKFLKI